MEGLPQANLTTGEAGPGSFRGLEGGSPPQTCLPRNPPSPNMPAQDGQHFRLQSGFFFSDIAKELPLGQ